MTNNFIDSSQNGDMQVDVGGRMVSMQTVQHIYNEITGRAEELTRNYSINHSVSFEDLCQLNVKICQLYEQYNIVSSNCAVTLFHVDDQKQAFSSFERFKLFDRTTLSPVENIRLEYHFLIVLPQVNKPQSYQIEINIQSRAAIAKRLKKEAQLPPGMIYQFHSMTARMEITYIDYTVARNFQVAIDGWFGSLHELPTNKLLGALKRLTPHFPFIFKLLSTIPFLIVCLCTYDEKYWSTNNSLGDLYRAAFVTFSGAYLLSITSNKLGSYFGGALRQIHAKSYLNLTRGDEQAMKELNDSNLVAWVQSIGAVTGAIAVNIFSGWLAVRLGLGN